MQPMKDGGIIHLDPPPAEPGPPSERPVERAAADSAARAPTREAAVAWPWWKRLGFRYLAAYFVLYTFPFPLDSVVGFFSWLAGKRGWDADALGWLSGVERLWNHSAVWVGQNLLGIEREIPVRITGSGDTTVDYLRLLLVVTLAGLVTLVWSLVDRRRRAYPRAARWLIVGCSFYLGLVLLGYGLAKVIPTQMSTPSLTRLVQPYGESSPMGIVWTFMGLMPAYTIFTGLAETLPGFLLFFRRTRLLGAMIAVAVLTNIVMLNYAFDVPVKLFSSHLLVMALALTLVHWRRLVAFFVRNRAAPPADSQPLVTSRKWNRALAAFGFFLAITAVVTGLLDAWEIYHQYGAGRQKPEIWGIHDVETFSADGEELPPLLTDETRWRALIVDYALPMKVRSFERPGRISIQRMDGKLEHRFGYLDEEAGTFLVLPEGQMSLEAAEEAGVPVTDQLRYERPEPGKLIVRGTLDGKEIEATLRERDLGEMLLISRGFRWINEYPFNR